MADEIPEMVERCARAIHDAYERYHEHTFDIVAWEQATPARKEWSAQLARAAIEALRAWAAEQTPLVATIDAIQP